MTSPWKIKTGWKIEKWRQKEVTIWKWTGGKYALTSRED